jgi:hypothetical protein
MAVGRLINIVLLVLMVGAVAGLLSIQGELTAAASAAHDGQLLVSQLDAKEPVMVVAELVPEGKELLILPQIPDMLLRRGREIEQLSGTCVYEDGKLYAWRKADKTRVWLFAVIADEKPRVTLDPQPARIGLQPVHRPSPIRRHSPEPAARVLGFGCPDDQ